MRSITEYQSRIRSVRSSTSSATGLIDGEELMIMKESDGMDIVDSGAAAGNKS